MTRKRTPEAHGSASPEAHGTRAGRKKAAEYIPCKFNSGVECSAQEGCGRCGWNPMARRQPRQGRGKAGEAQT